MEVDIKVDLMLRESGSMKATADVTLQTVSGPVTLLGFKVIGQEPGKLWVSLPAKEYLKGGKRCFRKVVVFSGPGKAAVTQAVLKAFEEQQKAA